MFDHNRLPDLAAGRGQSLASLFVEIGRNAAYRNSFFFDRVINVRGRIAGWAEGNRCWKEIGNGCFAPLVTPTGIEPVLQP